jgi:ubiquinone/menaquinone biosynthesis C-methylase UbiE
LLSRTSLKTVNSLLKEKSNWNILDIGCGYTANINANVVADAQDLNHFYKDKKFVQIKDKNLPFLNNEFDFVVSSHVIEHVEDFEFFIKELERVSKKGYIELPARLADNIVFENQSDHIWWFKFDDEKKKLVVSKKNQLIEPFLSVGSAKNLEKLFRESLILELMWQDKIEYRIDSSLEFKDEKKIFFLTFVRKYFSKKLRQLFKK